MKLFLVLDETRFFHPNFTEKIIQEAQKKHDSIVGALLIKKIPKKHSIDLYFQRHWYHLKFTEMLKLATRRFGRAFCEYFKQGAPGQFYSVQGVLDWYEIPWREVQGSINSFPYLDFIASKKPDLIISSCSLIFGRELLALPRLGCINRHSGLLPSYGGLLPVFQAYRRGESFTGATVHEMSPKIDDGKVLAQREVPIERNSSLYSLYEKCFEVSADLVLEAIEKKRKNDTQVLTSKYEPSYFSFPTSQHWQEFRRRGGRFI